MSQQQKLDIIQGISAGNIDIQVNNLITRGTVQAANLHSDDILAKKIVVNNELPGKEVHITGDVLIGKKYDITVPTLENSNTASYFYF